MNKQKITKLALPALLMSAMTFELMPGSVRYYGLKDGELISKEQLFNFFTVATETTSAACLPIAGLATFAAIVLALVALCFKKNDLYKATGWCSLASGALAAVPYMTQTAGVTLMPNVMVILILTVCWLLAMHLDKKKEAKEETKTTGRRL